MTTVWVGTSTDPSVQPTNLVPFIFGTTSTPPVVVPPVTGTPVISYPLAKTTTADQRFLQAMVPVYRGDLATIPGSHQIWQDMLTNSSGQTYWVLTGSTQAAFGALINQAVNATSYLPGPFDPATYTGPLKAIYANLVAYKLAGGK